LDSSENRLDTGALSILEVAAFSPVTGLSDSVLEILLVCGNGGGPIPRGSGLVCDGGGAAGGAGGAGRWGAKWCAGDGIGDFVAAMRLRMALPSNGAPISSSEVFVLRGRAAFAEGKSGFASLRAAMTAWG